jgi:hypothetical protein
MIFRDHNGNIRKKIVIIFISNDASRRLILDDQRVINTF